MRRQIAAASLSVVASLTACGGGEGRELSSGEVLNSCAPSDQWARLTEVFEESDLNLRAMAESLGVNEEQMEAATVGPVACRSSVSVEDIENGTAVVMVSNRGSRCLVIATFSDPSQNEESRDVLATCPAQS